jgi:hypothetical protein
MHHARPVTETFQDFLRPYLDGDNESAVARKLGMVATTYGRQLEGNMPVATVVKLCRKYSIPMLDAFVAAGFITAAEADVIGRTKGLRDATDRELALEALRRVEAGTASSSLTKPVAQEDLDEMARHREKRSVGRPGEGDVAQGVAFAATNMDAEGLDPETP